MIILCNWGEGRKIRVRLRIFPCYNIIDCVFKATDETQNLAVQGIRRVKAESHAFLKLDTAFRRVVSLTLTVCTMPVWTVAYIIFVFGARGK